MLSKIIRTEPAFFFGGLATLIGLVIPVLILFDLINWNRDQIAGVMGIVTFVTGFVSALIIRAQSVPNVIADRQMEIAKASDVTRPTDEIIAQAAKETK